MAGRVMLVLAALQVAYPHQAQTAQIRPNVRQLAGSRFAPTILISEPRFVTTSDGCPASAILLTGSASTTKVHWERISSDHEAAGCIFAVAKSLGKEATQHWLHQSGFAADFIDQFPVSSGNVLLSAGWSIKKNGLLYGNGISSFYNYFFAHSMSISLRWDRDGNLEVSWGYTYT